jgi:hypothetical protein
MPERACCVSCGENLKRRVRRKAANMLRDVVWGTKRMPEIVATAVHLCAQSDGEKTSLPFGGPSVPPCHSCREGQRNWISDCGL